MPTVYIIMGDRNTGKSSIARSLTGVSRSKRTKVATATGVIDIFVQLSSLQEVPLSPSDFIKAHQHEQYILIPLWIKQRLSPKPYPEGTDYLRAFSAAGWAVQEIAVLGRNTLPSRWPSGMPTPSFFPYSATAPINQTALAIRKAWGW